MLRTPFSTLALILLLGQPALALIEGGEGNEPVRDPGWPAGAGIVFNQPTRIAYWVGPPLGGSQWHGEYRGDANALNSVLSHFAKIDAKTRRVVVHDGIGYSFWLNPNRELPKAGISQIDWTFSVWEPKGWQRLRKLPPMFRPNDIGDDKTGPPAEIEIYTGGNIRWADVVVPMGVELLDQRLEAHGFKRDDGTVLEGTITDLESHKPIAGQVELQLSEAQKKGGYKYSTIGEAVADAKGHWVIKRAPAGSLQVVLAADGYVPRVVGYAQYDGQPGWHEFKGKLARPATLTGRVTDDKNMPLADVEVRLDDVACQNESYPMQHELRTKTDADGRFHLENIPKGSARIHLTKDSYCLVGLGPTIETPATDVALAMKQSAQLQVTVDFFGTQRPNEYLVDIEPEGGNAVGTWGGSSRIDNQNTVLFKGVFPGRYVLRGHPNPHNPAQLSDPITIELQGGATEKLVLPAKAKQ